MWFAIGFFCGVAAVHAVYLALAASLARAAVRDLPDACDAGYETERALESRRRRAGDPD